MIIETGIRKNIHAVFFSESPHTIPTMKSSKEITNTIL